MAKAYIDIAVNVPKWVKGFEAECNKASKVATTSANNSLNSSLKGMAGSFQRQSYFYQNTIRHAFQNPLTSAAESFKYGITAALSSAAKLPEIARQASSIAKEAYKDAMAMKALEKSGVKDVKSVAAKMGIGVSSSMTMAGAGTALAGSAGTIGLGLGAIEGLQMAAGLRILSEGLKQYADLEQTLTTIKVIAIGSAPTEKDLSGFKRLKEEIVRLGECTSWTQNQLAKATEVLTRGGFTVMESTKTLQTVSNVAKATATPLETVAQTMVGVLRTFSLPAESAQRIGDMMTKATSISAQNFENLSQAIIYAGSTANASGRTIEDLLTESAALANIGIRGTMQGTVLNNIATRAAGNKKAKSEYIKLGIDPFLNDGSGNIKNLVQLAREIRDAQGRAGYTQKQILESYWKMWGIYGQKGSALGTQDFEGIQKRIVEESAGTAQEQAKAMDSTLKGLVAIIKSQVVSGFTSGGEKVAPYFNRAMEEWIKVLGPNLKYKIENMFNQFATDMSSSGVLNAIDNVTSLLVKFGEASISATKHLMNFATWLSSPTKFKDMLMAIATSDNKDTYSDMASRTLGAQEAASIISGGLNKEYGEGVKRFNEAVEAYNTAQDEYYKKGYDKYSKMLAELNNKRDSGEISEAEYEERKKPIEDRLHKTARFAENWLQRAKDASNGIEQAKAESVIKQMATEMQSLQENVVNAFNALQDVTKRATGQAGELEDLYYTAARSDRFKAIAQYTGEFDSPYFQYGDTVERFYATADKYGLKNDIDIANALVKDMADSGESESLWRKKINDMLDWTEKNSQTDAHYLDNVLASGGLLWLSEDFAEECKRDNKLLQDTVISGKKDAIRLSNQFYDLANKFGRDANQELGEDGSRWYFDTSGLGYQGKSWNKIIEENTKVDATINDLGKFDRSGEGEDFIKNYTSRGVALLSDEKHKDILEAYQYYLDNFMDRLGMTTGEEAKKIIEEMLAFDWNTTVEGKTVNAMAALQYKGTSLLSSFGDEEKGAGYMLQRFAKALATQKGITGDIAGLANTNEDFSAAELTVIQSALSKAIYDAEEERDKAISESNDEKAYEMTTLLSGYTKAMATLGETYKNTDSRKSAVSSAREFLKDFVANADELAKLQEKFDEQVKLLLESGNNEQSQANLRQMNTVIGGTYKGNAESADYAGMLKYNGISLYDLIGNAEGPDLMKQFASMIAASTGSNMTTYTGSNKREQLNVEIQSALTRIKEASLVYADLQEKYKAALNSNTEAANEYKDQMAEVSNEVLSLQESIGAKTEQLKKLEGKGEEAKKETSAYTKFAWSSTFLERGATSRENNITEIRKTIKQINYKIGTTGKIYHL